jgi:hypothetical protein
MPPLLHATPLEILCQRYRKRRLKTMAESGVDRLAVANIPAGALLNPTLKASVEDLLRLVLNSGNGMTERSLRSFAPTQSLSGCKR